MAATTAPAQYGPRQHTAATREAEMVNLWASDLERDVRANDLTHVVERIDAMTATLARLRALTVRASA
jgi:hypothetical protein